jgi:hypothetical protein
MPHDQHQRDAESSRWEPNSPEYWPNTSNPDPEKRDPFPAIRILRCLRPNLGEILHLITDGRSVVE